MGPIVLKDFARTDLNYPKAGCWKGSLLAVQKFSSDLMEIPFQIKEFKEKQAEFYGKYFFNEKGKTAFATGSITFENGNILLIIEELDFQGFKTQNAKIATLNGVTESEVVSKPPINTYTPKEETPANNNFNKIKEESAQLNKAAAPPVKEPVIEQTPGFKAISATDFWKNSGRPDAE